MHFSSFGLDPAVLKSVEAEGYETPTPIQVEAIPLVLEGRDLFGLAQTGTGKTAAFALPILHRYYRDKRATNFLSRSPRKGPRCLVLTPTRELAMQVGESFSTYGRRTNLGVAVVFGGVGIVPQKEALRRRPEILVATPGRLLDLVGQGSVDLSSVDVFILDEADRMFDMGFIHDIRRVVALVPRERQTLLFSATMPDSIASLASQILRSPARVEVTPAHRAADTVSQRVYFVGAKQRIDLIAHLLEENRIQRCIVFTKMKHVANRVAETMRKLGIDAEAFHANKSQSARVRALSSFKNGQVRVLVATDIAARGLDVDDVEVVVNYDLPEVPETYVHRIGRAGRAGKTGQAWSVCVAEQRELLEDIERVTKVEPEMVREHPFADGATTNCLNAHSEFRENKGRRQAARRPAAAPKMPHPADRKPHPADRKPHPADRKPHPADRKPHPTDRRPHQSQRARAPR